MIFNNMALNVIYQPKKSPQMEQGLQIETKAKLGQTVLGLLDMHKHQK